MSTNEEIKIVSLKTRQEIDQFADYLKAFIDHGCSVTFGSTVSHTKIKEPVDGNQFVGLVTGVEGERVDEVVEYLVLSLTRNNKGEEPKVLEGLEEAVSAF